jgi:putative transposase
LARGGVDRANGFYPRQLLTSMGAIELQIPRTRSFSVRGVLQKYARREQQVDRMILGCFVLGLSTRKVGEALLPILGERVSASTVSRVAKTLDRAVEAFHRRRLRGRYRALVLDGVVLENRTGAGAQKRYVLTALGITPDERKEILDFRLARGESEAAWTAFLNDLYERGLDGESLEIVAIDGGAGLAAALEMVYPRVRVQRCWAHKVRNVLDKMKKKDREMAKRGLQRIYNAQNRRAGHSAARRFANRWEHVAPRAVQCLRRDLDELLAFFHFKEEKWRRITRTTNTIERRFREVKRRTRPMGVFVDRTSMERILYAVFNYENSKQGSGTLFSLTQYS